MKTIPVLLLSALALGACGSSGGTSTPPVPPRSRHAASTAASTGADLRGAFGGSCCV